MASLEARKRRRLNPPASRTLESAQQSDCELSSASVESDDYGNHTERHASKAAASRRTSKEAQRAKRRVHIVRNTSAMNDAFFSQLPNASQSPHRMRGAYWQKVPSPSTSMPVAASRIENSQGQATIQSVATALDEPALSPPESPDLSPPTHSSHQVSQQAIDQNLQAGQRPTVEKKNMTSTEDEALLLEELADFPLDMLSSPADMPPPETASIASGNLHRELPTAGNSIGLSRTPAGLAAPRSNFRQTTLFGGQVQQGSSQANRVHNWPLASRDEAPTHHALDHDAMKTWIYPTNLGTIRDYQYNIVARGLFSNLLVALPTGLGKTFIAAAIMLNWFRWTKNAQIVFVAPTRPLVAQQVNACFHIAGIPRSATSLLTGNVAPGLRAAEWSEKRVFFMTPQTFVNDLKTGICDPKRIVLVVVDEAHRATGNYAYVEVIRFLRRFNNSFRVLALTATPGSKVETVQEVIDGLGIARTEIRTEDSLDIRQYVHQRNVDSMLFDYDDDMQFVMDLLRNAIKPVLQIVNSMNACWVKDPMALTSYGCQMARTTYMRSDAGRTASFGLKGMVQTILSTLGSLGIAIELLKFHGIAPFYHKMLSFENDDAENGKKGSKYKNQILQHQDFKTMMSTVRGWTRKEDFLGHPKLEYLSQVILNHFIDAGEGRGLEADISPAATRVMVFTHYRDSAEEIVRVLQRHSPMVRPHVFVGQAASRMSEGMDQKRQQTIIEDFKKGVYNTLIATSIGEEGLDIGQVDLIICYDASASPIRMLQRMGRTGRKRAGNIVVLLMKDKEQMNFEKAKDNYEKIQQMITDGSRFVYHTDSSPRIIPRGIDPEVEKRAVEIPIENSQADGELPEPKKRGRPPKRPPKKFHMPDGVITGFLKASEMGADGKEPKRRQSGLKRSPTPDPMPDLKSVFLAASQEAELEQNYLDVGGDDVQMVSHPRLDQYSELQREERPSKLVSHGSATWRTIQLLNTMHDMDEELIQTLERNLQHSDKVRADDALAGRAFPRDDLHDETNPIDHAPHRKVTTRKPLKAKAASKSKAAPKAKGTPRPSKKSKKAQGPKKRRKNDPVEALENEGIDLMTTDDEHEIDEDDDGSDLLDFIDDATQVEPPSSSSSPPDRLPKKGKARGSHHKQYEHDAVTMSQVTDGSLPDAEHLIGSRRQRKPSPARRKDSGRPRVMRQIVQDDSDDE